MPIGTESPGEMISYRDAESGRSVRQWTTAAANSYPLYYFIPSITDDGRYLILHSERSGWVQLYRMSLTDGSMVQLTDGRTRDAGWAPWCEYHLRGIYNHLSALNVQRREVYYFQDRELRCTHVDTLENRKVYDLGERVSRSQTSFSPDGRWFAFVHTDRHIFAQRIADRLTLEAMSQPFDEMAWGHSIACTISLINTETGERRDVVELDHHVNHVLFLDNQRLLVNHPKHDHGAWQINIDGTGYKELRPRDENGAICHQCVTANGILYEVYDQSPPLRRVSMGRYDLRTETWQEFKLPHDRAWHHTGNDPAGRLCFADTAGTCGLRGIYTIHHPLDDDRRRIQLVRSLAGWPIQLSGQRGHAHPFLTPDRQWIFHNAIIDGYAQVCAVDVGDLAELDEFWPT